MSLPSLPGRAGFLTEENHKEWDEFVAGHPWATIFHTTFWKGSLEDAFKHIKGHILAIRNPQSGRIEGGLVIYAVRSWLLGNRLISVPFSDSGDPLINSSGQLRQLLPHLIQLQGRTSARYIEVKVKFAQSFFDGSGLVSGDHFKHHSTPLNQHLDQLWASLSRTAVRRMVNKAVRSGITVRQASDLDEVRVFCEMLAQSRQRLGLPAIPYGFFRSIWQHIHPARRLILMAFHKGLPVGAVFGLVSFAQFHLEYSAELEEARSMGVGQLLYWKAIELAVQSGCREFGFGRTSPGNVGLMSYKSHWNTTVSDLHSFIYPGVVKRKVDRGATSTSYLLARKLFTWAPGPWARALGRMFYRHWG